MNTSATAPAKPAGVRFARQRQRPRLKATGRRTNAADGGVSLLHHHAKKLRASRRKGWWICRVTALCIKADTLMRIRGRLTPKAVAPALQSNGQAVRHAKGRGMSIQAMGTARTTYCLLATNSPSA